MRVLLRAKRLQQNPPSMARVKLVFGIIAACLVLAGIGKFVGTPDWMKVERVNLRTINR
jgi:hypothetical protein